MSEFLGLIGDFIPMLGGLFSIAAFGGYYTPKHKSEEDRIKFETYAEKHGKKMVVLGYLLVIISIIQLGLRFI